MSGITKSESVRPDAGGSKRSLKRTALRLLGVLIIVIVVTVILGEIVLRLFVGVPMGTPYAKSDPVFSYVNKPGVSGRHSRPGGYSYRFRINSKGLRGKECSYEKPENTLRILCLGDSFTFGLGAGEDETFPAVLERELFGKLHGKKAEVLNAGVSGTGTSRQCAWYEAEGRKYTPDIVILGFFTDDWFGSFRPFYVMQGNGLVRNVPYRARPTLRSRLRDITEKIPFYSFLMTHSQLANMFKLWVVQAVQGGGNKARVEHRLARDARKARGRRSASQEQQHFEIELMLKKFNKECQKDGAKLIVCMIPALQSVQYYLNAPRKRGGELPELSWVTVPEYLEDCCRRLGLTFVDATPVLVRQCRKRSCDPMVFYHRGDEHCTPAGYAVIGKLLAEKVLAANGAER